LRTWFEEFVGHLAFGDDRRRAHGDTTVRTDHICEERRRDHLYIELPRVTFSPEHFDLTDHRVDHRSGQSPTDAGDEPDRGFPNRGRCGNRRRTERNDGTVRINRQSLNEDQVGRPSDQASSTGVDRFVFDVMTFQMTHEPCGAVADIECEYTNVATPHEALTDNVRRPDSHNRCRIGKLLRQLCCSSISADFRSQFPDSLEGLG